jgi:hypothetical protein
VKQWFATLLWENPDPNVAIFRIKVSLFFWIVIITMRNKVKKKEKTLKCSKI